MHVINAILNQQIKEIYPCISNQNMKVSDLLVTNVITKQHDKVI